MTFWPTFVERNQRFILTMVSKKFFAWWIATALLVYKYVDANSWVFFTCAVFGFDTFQKYKGLDNGNFTRGGQSASIAPGTVGSPVANRRATDPRPVAGGASTGSPAESQED